MVFSPALSHLSVEELLRKQKRLRRQFLANQNGPRELRIAVLGGVTTDEVVGLLELLLLDGGFRPVFYQSEYNRYFEDAVLEPGKLAEFRPEIVYIHTHWMNARNNKLGAAATAAELQDAVAAELARYQQIWNSLDQAVVATSSRTTLKRPRSGCWGIRNAYPIAAGHASFGN